MNVLRGRTAFAKHGSLIWGRNHNVNGHSDTRTASAFIDTERLLSPPHSLLAAHSPDAGQPKLKIVILGLSITSSWENRHAATYRGIVRELSSRGHDVLFLERDTECFSANRDLPTLPYGRVELYSDVKDLKQRFGAAVREAHFIMVGSSVQEGIAIGEWVTRIAQGATAFYDIDTPATMANLLKGKADYLSPALIPRYQIYLSITGGPLLSYIEKHYGSPMARPLYCSVDATQYFPEERALKWDLGYMGTYSDDRQRALDRLLLEPAQRWGEGRFAVAGPQYPRSIHWPRNVKRFAHLSPSKHRDFYN
jgi:spore maturation protein CgeB